MLVPCADYAAKAEATTLLARWVAKAVVPGRAEVTLAFRLPPRRRKARVTLMGKFGSQKPSQKRSAPSVASLDAARIARQKRAEQATRDSASADMRRLLAQQIHHPYPADSPLGRAMEAGLDMSVLPHNREAVEPKPLGPNIKDVPKELKPQVPQGRAGED
jgi:hypothetical protein